MRSEDKRFKLATANGYFLENMIKFSKQIEEKKCRNSTKVLKKGEPIIFALGPIFMALFWEKRARKWPIWHISFIGNNDESKPLIVTPFLHMLTLLCQRMPRNEFLK